MAEHEIQPFGEWIDSLMTVEDGYAHYNALISELTEKAGHKVSVRNLQRYRARTVVPSYESAKVLMDVLHVDTTADEIMESLALERSMQNRQDINYEPSIRTELKVSDLAKALGLDNETDAEEIVTERAQELFRGTGSINRYIISLIKKDITENILED